MEVNMKKYYIIFILFFLLAGCANNKVWYKLGSSDNEFQVDQYACMIQAKQQPSYANGGAVIDWNLFSSCMNARGWRLIDKDTMN
jgi:hypothetical protein